MKCVIIFGPSAVGKATVGKELANNLGYKLFHNHMVIELVHNFFTWSDAEFGKLVGDIRNRIFEEIKASRITGVVFTYVWALDQQSDHDELMDYMKSLGVVFEDIYFVELSANQEERLERNKDERRLAEKKTKRNIEESERFIFESETKYKLNSNGDFMYPDQHLKIDNTKLTVGETTKLITEGLGEFYHKHLKNV